MKTFEFGPQRQKVRNVVKMRIAERAVETYFTTRQLNTFSAYYAIILISYVSLMLLQ